MRNGSGFSLPYPFLLGVSGIKLTVSILAQLFDFAWINGLPTQASIAVVASQLWLSFWNVNEARYRIKDQIRHPIKL